MLTPTHAMPAASLHHALAAAFSEVLRTELAALGAPTQPVDAEAPARERDAVVLVVDDEADMRAYLRACLAPRWRVAEAAGGQEALAYARTHTPDLVVADVRMPAMDGVALCRALAADARTAGVPVLLVSGQPPPVPAGDAFLAKPFTRRCLVRRVEALLGGRADGGGTAREAP